MDGIRRHRDAAANVAALALPLGVAAILVPFRSSFADPASALVLVAVVVAVAAVGNRTAGFLATISTTVWFDFFLTRPYQRFAITHRPDVETAVSLFVVGIVVTELAVRNRHHHEAATEESEYVGLIYEVSELAALGTSAEEVIERVRIELMDLLHLRACHYEPGNPEHPRRRIEDDGHVILGSALWGVDDMGLPGQELELLVKSRGQTLGRFVVKPTPGFPVSLRRRLVAVTMANQVGPAIGQRLPFGAPVRRLVPPTAG
jgi:hypothetical protein